MFYVFKELLDKKEFQVVRSTSSHPEVFEGLAFGSGGTKCFMLANFTDQQIEVRIDDLKEGYGVVELDDNNVERAMYDPEGYLSLPPQILKFDRSSAIVILNPFGISFIRE